MEESQPKIMTKPLPEILDDLEDLVRQAETAAANANNASRKAVEEATKSLLDQINEVRGIAHDALALAQAMNRGIAASVKAYNDELEKLIASAANFKKR